jgi:hypothetical protein
MNSSSELGGFSKAVVVAGLLLIFCGPAAFLDRMLFRGMVESIRVGGDVMAILFVLPFNALAVLGLEMAREFLAGQAHHDFQGKVRGFRVRHRRGGKETRVRLPHASARIVGLLTLAGTAFLAYVVLRVTLGESPPLAATLAGLITVPFPTVAAYRRRARLERKGYFDLVLDNESRTLTFPPATRSTTRETVPLDQIYDLQSEIAQLDDDGAVVSYKVVVYWTGEDRENCNAQLVRLANEDLAKGFVRWLKKQILEGRETHDGNDHAPRRLWEQHARSAQSQEEVF